MSDCHGEESTFCRVPNTHIYRTGSVNPLEPPIKYNFLQLIKRKVSPLSPKFLCLQKLISHLTYPHLGPVAGAVVPLHAVVVPGVEDGQAGLHRHPGPVQQVLRVVRLGHVVGHELREVT